MPATRSSWKRLEAPVKREDLALHLLFNDADAEKMMESFVPHQMEDKWFIYFEEGWLWFHRSWTGALIYAVRLDGCTAGVRVIESWVSRDPDQYNQTDIEFDRTFVRYLIDRLLLQKTVPFPRIPNDPQRPS